MLRRPQTPTGYTIFCDDIRDEVGGKKSLMGVYSGDIIVTDPLPVTLTKLALSIVIYFSPADERHDIQLKVYGPGPNKEDIVLVSGVVPMLVSDEIGPMPKVEIPMISATINVVLAPFKIVREGNLRVRAYYRDEEIPLGNLVLKHEPDYPAIERQMLPTS